MDAKTKICQYRERLDKTLACTDLTDENKIRTNVESRMLQSPEYKTRENIGNLPEKRTNELVELLGMLRSASMNDEINLNAEWKVKQDTEEFRVMYREGPPGTPFHVLLVEGYLDGPVDACLCVAWETTLYKKWWPQFNYPAFKVTSSQCIHEAGIGEKICTVRMKVPWPLSAREALLHYYEFEFFQEDLTIVIMKTIDDVERDGCSYGITNDMIPESNNVVRIGVDGGLAIQKVNNERCYFRFIASLDMKLDFVSPSLINFIARQLIGNGFKLCQKAVASISKGNKDFSEALEGPMYRRIRLAGHLPEMIKVLEPDNIETYDGNDTERDIAESEIKTSATNIPMKIHEGKSTDDDLNDVSEIEEDDNNASASEFSAIKVVKSSTDINGNKMHIRPEVEQALFTLDRVIEAVRELRVDKKISSNTRQRVSRAVQCKITDTEAYELPTSSMHINSGFTAEISETNMLNPISTKSRQGYSLHSSTSEVTTRPLHTEHIANNIDIVGSNVDNGVHECRAEKPKVGIYKNPKATCFRWSCNPRRRFLWSKDDNNT